MLKKTVTRVRSRRVRFGREVDTATVWPITPAGRAAGVIERGEAVGVGRGPAVRAVRVVVPPPTWSACASGGGACERERVLDRLHDRDEGVEIREHELGASFEVAADDDHRLPELDRLLRNGAKAGQRTRAELGGTRQIDDEAVTGRHGRQHQAQGVDVIRVDEGTLDGHHEELAVGVGGRDQDRREHSGPPG